MLTSGPCTSGPGQIVDTDISQHVRHWPDIQTKNDVAKYVKDSTAFYTKLIERACEANCAMNVFSCSTDQIGLYEMNALCRETGGTMMISESFAYQAFTRTWRIFLEMQSDSNPEAPIKSQGGSTMQVSCSPNIKIHGVLGPCHSLKTGG